MRDKIWKASTEAKFTQIYTEITCQRYKKISLIVNVVITIFSGSGVLMGLGFWKTGTIYPLIACGVITSVQIIKAVIPKLFPSEKGYKKLNDVIDFYFSHHNEYHKLWYEFENNEITEKVARDRYFKIVEKEKPMLKIVNDILTDNNKKRKRKALKETQLFFNQ